MAEEGSKSLVGVGDKVAPPAGEWRLTREGLLDKMGEVIDLAAEADAADDREDTEEAAEGWAETNSNCWMTWVTLAMESSRRVRKTLPAHSESVSSSTCWISEMIGRRPPALSSLGPSFKSASHRGSIFPRSSGLVDGRDLRAKKVNKRMGRMRGRGERERPREEENTRERPKEEERAQEQEQGESSRP